MMITTKGAHSRCMSTSCLCYNSCAGVRTAMCACAGEGVPSTARALPTYLSVCRTSMLQALSPPYAGLSKHKAPHACA